MSCDKITRKISNKSQKQWSIF